MGSVWFFGMVSFIRIDHFTTQKVAFKCPYLDNFNILIDKCVIMRGENPLLRDYWLKETPYAHQNPGHHIQGDQVF